MIYLSFIGLLLAKKKIYSTQPGSRLGEIVSWGGGEFPLPKDTHTHTHTHIYPFNGPLSRTTQVSRYQKGKTNLDFTGARDSESGSGTRWAICKSAPRTRQTTTPAPHRSVFLQAGCLSCRPTNSVRALKAKKFFNSLKHLVRATVAGPHN